MPRRARMYISGLPYHVVQRGNNREACFIEPENYQFYLELWKDLSARYGVAVHAYCLMTNHVHFLVTPDRDAAISNTMKVVGSRYAQYINKQYRRTGTLWEGRHRASLVQSERYLLTCMRYIELNPEYRNLGSSSAERGFAYRELFKAQISEEDLHFVRKAAHYCQPVGDDRFRKQIERRYGIHLGQMGRGRPREETGTLFKI